MCAGRLSLVQGRIVSHLSAMNSTVWLCGWTVIFVVPPWLILRSCYIGDSVKDGSFLVPSLLVVSPASLVSDSWTNVKDFL